MANPDADAGPPEPDLPDRGSPGHDPHPAAGTEGEPTAPAAPAPGTATDAAFAEIVAGLADLGQPPRRGAPAPDEPGSAMPFAVAPWVRSSGPRDAPRPSDDVGDDVASHFEPPEPAPVLGRDPLLTLGWGVVVLVPLGIIASLVLRLSVPPVVLQVAGAVAVLALVLLWWRMPSHRDDDDQGAVV
ncbi:hypothetical protein GCM10011331_15130 [Flavimobilis marinus]|uniref:Uncharacterized protein n=1 Tax=Flavimobilis marinus TaxID=285351 RepID=A0A1I2FPK5_9MICO|nr:hypothetical protein [Flavimobilis marinus]GHG51470.1 hypothetical protein GCM10011331_15130 [Flavimobilis marinus]SFF07414.1 hypothetical protein SAMN04488035_1451 [Flavimobilis marinus]